MFALCLASICGFRLAQQSVQVAYRLSCAIVLFSTKHVAETFLKLQHSQVQQLTGGLLKACGLHSQLFILSTVDEIIGKAFNEPKYYSI
jgi:hypothetical protein